MGLVKGLVQRDLGELGEQSTREDKIRYYRSRAEKAANIWHREAYVQSPSLPLVGLYHDQ